MMLGTVAQWNVHLFGRSVIKAWAVLSLCITGIYPTCMGDNGGIYLGWWGRHPLFRLGLHYHTLQIVLNFVFLETPNVGAMEERLHAGILRRRPPIICQMDAAAAPWSSLNLKENHLPLAEVRQCSHSYNYIILSYGEYYVISSYGSSHPPLEGLLVLLEFLFHRLFSPFVHSTSSFFFLSFFYKFVCKHIGSNDHPSADEGASKFNQRLHKVSGWSLSRRRHIYSWWQR